MTYRKRSDVDDLWQASMEACFTEATWFQSDVNIVNFIGHVPSESSRLK